MANGKHYKRTVFSAIALIAAGCASVPTKPTVGMISSNPTGGVRVGSPAPDVPFLDRDGTWRPLSAVYEDATVLAFTRSLCTELNPRLVAVSADLARNVALIQICLCNGECCKNHNQCLQTMADRAKHMIVICDPQKELRRRYRVDESSEVFVVGRRGRVVGRGKLADLPTLVRFASELAEQTRQEHEALYGG